MPRFEFGEHTVDTLRLIGAGVDVLSALDGLVACFDQHGECTSPKDLTVRLDAARDAIDKAVPPDLRRWA